MSTKDYLLKDSPEMPAGFYRVHWFEPGTKQQLPRPCCLVETAFWDGSQWHREGGPIDWVSEPSARPYDGLAYGPMDQKWVNRRVSWRPPAGHRSRGEVSPDEVSKRIPVALLDAAKFLERYRLAQATGRVPEDLQQASAGQLTRQCCMLPWPDTRSSHEPERKDR